MPSISQSTFPVVSEIAGHAITAITAKVYAHATANGKQQAADALDDIFGASS
jgi:hypothetical protein